MRKHGRLEVKSAQFFGEQFIVVPIDCAWGKRMEQKH